MNRAQRRARLSGPSREQLNRRPSMLVRQQQFFKPLDDLIDMLDAAGVVEAVQGRAVVRLDADTTMTYADQALTETASWIGRWCEAHRHHIDTEPLIRLSAKLRNSMPLFERDVADCKRAIDSMRRLVLTMTEVERKSLDLTRQIENELEACNG